MNTSMSTGTTALNAFQKALDVQSNNLANTATTSYKADFVSFSDMMYDRQVGLGTSMDTPRKNYSQGGLQPTNSDYDFAIDGSGFFTLQDPMNPERLLYTRAGQFKNDSDNYLADAEGRRVLGIVPVVTGDVITSSFVNDIVSNIIETETSVMSVNTYATDYIVSARTTGATGTSGQNFKTVDSNINDIELLITEYGHALKAYALNPIDGEVAQKAQSSITFPTTGIVNDEYTLELFVDGIKFQQNFDESIENTLKLLSDKINTLAGVSSSVNTTTGELTINSMIAGSKLPVSQAKLNNNMIPIVKLQEATGTGQNLVDAIYADLKALMQSVNADVATNKSEILKPQSGQLPTMQPLILDLHELGMNSTLYEKLLSGDPEKVAAYPGIESEDGFLYLKDGDARFLIGKLAPVTFTDMSKLDPQGDNLYAKGYEQADPIFLEEAATVVGKYLEYSNVDLSKELVNLLTFQKAFEANSKSITTSDELLKTALALKNR